MLKPLSLLLLLIFVTISLNGQTNFRQALEKADPIPSDSILGLQEKLKIHQAFLDKAITEKDKLKQLFGNIYLYYDYILAENYIEPEKYILEAKKIADQSENAGWQGWVNYRTGIFYVRTSNVDKAIDTYKAAVPLCKVAGDSLCVAESYEQLCIMSGLLGNFNDAHYYFNLALPLLKEYGTSKNLCTAYSNYGSVVSMMGKSEEAIEHFRKSIEFCGNIKRYDAQASNLNNIGDSYRRSQQYDKAIEAYEKGVEFNKVHNFDRIRVKNYMGLYLVHSAKGNYELATEYLIQRYELKDSLMGLEVQEKIANLETKFEKQKKELELEKSKSQLHAAENRIRLIGMLLALILLTGILVVWYYYRRQQKMKLKLIQNKENLKQLTKTLIRKNAALKSLEDQLLKQTKDDLVIKNEEIIEEELLNQTILSSDDWSEFKFNFNKAYPGFILKLRKSHTLSEAEERLFLLLKLKLTRNEIAAILGISPDTVKKTRTRLRKRLNLKSEVSLENVAVSF